MIKDPNFENLGLSRRLPGRQVSGATAARSLQSTTMASWSPLGASSAAPQTIWTWVKRVSGRGAPSQTSLMYRDTRNAAVAEEEDEDIRMQIHSPRPPARGPGALLGAQTTCATYLRRPGVSEWVS